MFPDNADRLHGPDSNHDLDLLHRRGKLGISLQLWRESVFPLELTSAGAGDAAAHALIDQVMSFIPKHLKSICGEGKKNTA